MLHIGKDGKTGEAVYIEAGKSRAVLVCGKRGSGKSYTLGSLIEELRETDEALTIIVDPMGIYHTMGLPNVNEERMLWDWGLSSRGFPVLLLVPGDPIIRYGGREVTDELERRSVRLKSFRINPGDLSPDAWCDFMDLGINDVMGIALYRAVQNATRKLKRHFFLPDLTDEVASDGKTQDRTKEALLNRLEWARDLDIFSDVYREMLELFDPDAVNVVDLSPIDSSRYGLRNLVVDVLARDIFQKRTVARRKEELGLSPGLPRVWMAIDEAHQFVPAGRASLAKEALIRWAKEGRQPGLSLVVASQQPSAIDSEVLTQCDIILCHKLTNMEDVQAINRLSQDYMGNELRTYIRNIRRSGEAVMVDDERERVNVVQIRPRRSSHGGGEVRLQHR